MLTQGPPSILYLRLCCQDCGRTASHHSRRCRCGSRRLEPFLSPIAIERQPILRRLESWLRVLVTVPSLPEAAAGSPLDGRHFLRRVR